ncbi:hypothetical protein [Flaviflexus massiliensis]|uniref:hypothetical protein n=1 Tax=Flaviflexus massiliensis TaxID=1522309 RepID=UPI00164DCA77|nr:hypothetical protein [Flaviflexus massiliensis]
MAPLQRPIRTRVGTSTPPTYPPVPVVLGQTLVTQADATKCGAAVLLMLEASGDPTLARELENNPELITTYQQTIHDRVSRRAVGPVDWPQSFGSPPWTLAREARFPGVTYRAHALDDRTEHGRDLLHAVLHANQSGIPVPLYTGGNIGQGLARALPRHVVLAVPHTLETRSSSLRIYEPSAGMLYDVSIDELLKRTTKHRALGNWTHVVWAILPYPTKSA